MTFLKIGATLACVHSVGRLPVQSDSVKIKCITGVISLARLCSNLPGSLSGPDYFDTSILSSNMKTPFSEICRGSILGHLVPGNWGNVFTD